MGLTNVSFGDGHGDCHVAHVISFYEAGEIAAFTGFLVGCR